MVSKKMVSVEKLRVTPPVVKVSCFLQLSFKKSSAARPKKISSLFK
jgi:hypothetical protein